MNRIFEKYEIVGNDERAGRQQHEPLNGGGHGERLGGNTPSLPCAPWEQTWRSERSGEEPYFGGC